MLEDLHVAGTVHRLQHEPAPVLGLVAGRLGRKHVFAIPVPMAGGLPQRLVENLRRVDLAVVARQAAAHIGDQFLEDGPALRVPEHHAGALFLEVKQVEFAPELAVIALLGLLDLLQVGVEVFLFRERRAVDPRQHRIVAVAAPISARDLHQLERIADLAGGRHVGSAAQIEPVALLVNLDRLVGWDGVDQFDLEHLAVVGEHLLGLFARPDFLGEGFVARDDLTHPLFDCRKIFRRERLVAEEIVIEAVLDHRADRHLRARPQRLHGFREHVRRIVSDQFQRAGIVARDEFDFGVMLYTVGEIGEFPIERHGHRALGQRRRDAFGDLQARAAFGEVARRAVGEGEGDFFCRLGRFQVGDAVLESRRGFVLVGHRSLLWLTPANERR